MNELLIAVGIFVFMMTIYGAVVIGGHLLRELRAQTVLADDLISDELLARSDGHVADRIPATDRR